MSSMSTGSCANAGMQIEVASTAARSVLIATFHRNIVSDSPTSRSPVSAYGGTGASRVQRRVGCGFRVVIAISVRHPHRVDAQPESVDDSARVVVAPARTDRRNCLSCGLIVRRARVSAAVSPPPPRRRRKARVGRRHDRSQRDPRPGRGTGGPLSCGSMIRLARVSSVASYADRGHPRWSGPLSSRCLCFSPNAALQPRRPRRF